jgi:microcystin-dependent protein
MAQPYLGQLILVGFNFAPLGYMFCQGQLLSIAQYSALFQLIGTTYGGDGQTTFALPDLRSRIPIHVGQGPGLSNYLLGDVGGTEQITLTVSQMPSHTHAVDTSALTATARCKNAAGNQQTPIGGVPAVEAAGVTATYSNAAPDSSMHASAVSIGGTATAANSGGTQPHDNLQPYLTLNYCIAVEGVFPSQ